MDTVSTHPPDHLPLSAAAPGTGPDLGALSAPVPRLSPDTPLAAAERLFTRDHGLSCVAVAHPGVPGLVGLLDRARCWALMTGPFGYGRSLNARRPVVEVAQWDALVLPPHLDVTEAASRAISRTADHSHDPVLVQQSGEPDAEVAAVAMPVLLSALATALARQALTDPLTGLANRAAFFGRVEESSRRSATRTGHRTAVLYLDLDGFKKINDTLGHEAGDQLLCLAAAALQSAARPEDLVARLGGDEFAVCLDVVSQPGRTGPDPVAEIAGRLHDAVASAGRDLAMPVQVSTGVAVGLAGAPVEAAELVRAADLAMYTQKRAGGDRVSAPVEVAGPTDADPLLGTTFAAAAAAGQFFLLYQPIVELATRETASLEALVRWRHPRLGLLTPDAFLPALQRTGELVELDDWVLRRAVAEFSDWLPDDAGPRPFLNINVSSDRLLAPDLAPTILAAAADAGLDPARIRLEVPEHLLVGDLEAALRQLRQLQTAGVAVTLDDVGAGETSLRHLRDVLADGIKIDRSYVAGVADDDRDRALVHMLVDFADSTDAHVTAEGVETEDQLRVLLQMGCRFGQGWLFGRPGPLAA